MTDRSSIAAIYDAAADAYRRRELGPRQRYLNAIEFRELAPLLNAQTDLVDLGCGLGRVAAFAPIAPRLYCGVDVSRNMLTAARERCAGKSAHHFVLADASALPLPDSRFDIATCIGLYEFVEDLGPYLKEVRRILRDDGQFIFTCHTLTGAARYNRAFQNYRRVGYEPMQIERAIGDAGLRLVSMRPAFALSRVLSLALLRLGVAVIGAWLALLDDVVASYVGSKGGTSFVVVASCVNRSERAIVD